MYVVWVSESDLFSHIHVDQVTTSCRVSLSLSSFWVGQDPCVTVTCHRLPLEDPRGEP